MSRPGASRCHGLAVCSPLPREEALVGQAAWSLSFWECPIDASLWPSGTWSILPLSRSAHLVAHCWAKRLGSGGSSSWSDTAMTLEKWFQAGT